MIPFKAKAWLDLTDRKFAGEYVDSKNIKKQYKEAVTGLREKAEISFLKNRKCRSITYPDDFATLPSTVSSKLHTC